MKISLKGIFILTTVLIFIKICISAYLSYAYLITTQKAQNDLMIGHVIHSHITLTAADKIDDKRHFVKDFKLINHNVGMEKFLNMKITAQKPSGLYVLKGDKLSNEQLKHFIEQLRHNRSLSIAAFYPHNHLYVVYKLKAVNEYTWMVDISVILLGFVFVLFAWWLIFFYYNNILPKDLLNSLKSDKPTSGTQRLREKIQAFYQEKNLMLSALSHDIKTPLTEAMLKLELLEDHKTAKSIQKNLDDIHQIVKSSLDFSQSQQNIHKVPLNIGSLIEQMAEAYHSKTFKVHFTAPPEALMIDADIAFIRRLLQNIFNNAKAYASALNIHAAANKHELTLFLNDNGPGVPKDALPKLGTPYFRVDASRSRNTGGTGLGLAIIQKIAKLHGGSAEFGNGPEGGFLVTVKIPLTDHSRKPSPDHSGE